MGCMEGRRGFTLIELMATIVIILILSITILYKIDAGKKAK